MQTMITHVVVDRDFIDAWKRRHKFSYSTVSCYLGVNRRTLTRWLQASKIPWAHFKLLQTLIAQTKENPDKLFKRALYGNQPPIGFQLTQEVRS